MSDSYTRIPNHILDNMAQLTPYGVAVLMFIARKTIGWSKHQDRISYGQIAEATGISRRKVIDVCKELVDQGFICCQTHENGVNTYALLVHDMHPPSAQHAPPSAPHAPEVVHSMHPPSAQHAPTKERLNKTKQTNQKKPPPTPPDPNEPSSADADSSAPTPNPFEANHPEANAPGESLALAELLADDSQSLKKSTNEQHEVLSRRRGASIDYGELLAAYNDNCGGLPKASTLNTDRKRKLKKLVDEHDFHRALQLLQDATRQIAGDEFWLERGYNLDNLLRGKVLEKAEKFRAMPVALGTGERRMAQTYMNIMDAISGYSHD
jgi:phage replication O-like protein O